MEDKVRIRITWMPVCYDEAAFVGYGFLVFLYQPFTTFQPGAGQAQYETRIGRPYEGCDSEENAALFAQDYIYSFPRYPRFMFDDDLPLRNVQFPVEIL